MTPLTAPPTPARLGYRMPAEWEPHAATWLSWPHNPETWPGKLSAIPSVYTEIVRALVSCEKVRICVPNDEVRREAEDALRYGDAWNDNVELHVIPTNDSWTRDHGPCFVKKGHDLRIVKWEYNAWGEKYPPWEDDNRMAIEVAERLGFNYWRPDIVLEGGSIDVNGCGTVLTTEACLLNPNRNPHLSRTEIEQYLRDYLGVSKILWLNDGIAGDDTDGHIDDITRFVSPDTVVTAVEENPADENHDVLRTNLERLQKMTDQSGRPLHVVELPMPDAVYHDSQRLPASYANFLIANKAVLLPVYGCKNDRRAIAIMQRLFPSRRIVPIDCTNLVWGLGAIHCITRQEPA